MVLNLTALLCKLLGSKKLILSDILSRPSISVVSVSAGLPWLECHIGDIWAWWEQTWWWCLILCGMESTILSACRKLLLATPEEPSRFKIRMGVKAYLSKAEKDTVLRASSSIVLSILNTVKHHAHVCKWWWQQRDLSCPPPRSRALCAGAVCCSPR